MVSNVDVRTDERYYVLSGTVFRVRLDRLKQGAHYLRYGAWVWTPITSSSVIENPGARELNGMEADQYRTIP